MRNSGRVRLFFVVLILWLALPLAPGQAAAPHQEIAPEQRAQEILARLTPEEKIGQLFLVTFEGTKVGTDTQIYDLIVNHYLSGVILLAENDNFGSGDQAVGDAWQMINQLQTSKHSSSQRLHTSIGTGATFRPAYIPLLIGTSQEGDGYPNDQILNGLTTLPSQLAIGATWDPELARRVGLAAGTELHSIGINLLLGPSLDVNEVPSGESAGDLGIRTFGGDPFWVGEMGRAYITGLHQGSNNQLLVVSKHFPGLGSSDRLPKDEVATVRKSLEQLKQIELAPFFAVTGLAETADETTDALLTSHIRYQGLQGNIRSTTRPVSLDQQALSLLLDLPALAEWRDNGGVMISDDVANRAVRSFYDPTGEEFNLRRSALDAFLAGNDLIYVGGLLTNPEPIDGEAPPTDGYAEILDTLNFFVQKYSEDPTFAERVDASVARILTIKYRLYGFFTLNLVLAPGDLEVAGSFEQTTFEVAQQAATLINPPLSELDNVLPNTPERNERIVFFTDTYDVRLCPDCEEQPIVPVDAMEQAILALYGPEAGGQVQASMLTSYSFADLEAMLDQKTDTELVEGNIRRAQWLVFFMLDVTPARAESLALRRFLSERPDLLREKSIVAFAANAPYYLDATDISKLTAYYALFSKPLPFFNVAARLLFKEIPVPQGDLPVSVPGVGYDLISATSPDPARVIPLFVDLPGEVFPESSEIPLDAATYTFALGDTIPIRTGTILDYNGNPVPSNTPVQFTVIVNGVEMPTIQTITNEGVASASVVVQQAGTIQIQADSGLATSNVLLIEIPEEVTTPEPSPSVTATDEPTPTASPTVPAPTPTPIVLIKAPPPTPGLGHWILAVMVAILIGWSANRAGALMGKTRWGIQWGLATFIGSMLAYIYAILELPGSSWAKNPPYFWGILIVVVMGGVIGWGIMAAFTAPKWQSGSKTAAPPKSRS